MFKKKIIPILLLSLFIIPMILGGVLFFYHDYFHFNTTNHGTLITPPIQIDTIFGVPQKKWQIVYIFDEKCQSECLQISHSLSQVQKSLGKESHRVMVKTLQYQPNQSLDALFQLHLSVAQKIYLIDPVGNVFMYYPETDNPMHILKDLKKVLEVSQIG